jgi:hypothetical protein
MICYPHKDWQMELIGRGGELLIYFLAVTVQLAVVLYYMKIIRRNRLQCRDEHARYASSKRLLTYSKVMQVIKRL